MLVVRARKTTTTVNTPKVELFYGATITFSQTLGTALGDWMAASPSEPAATTGTLDLGYLGDAAVFATGFAIIAALHFWTRLSRPMLFWAASILTRRSARSSAISSTSPWITAASR